MPHDDLKAAALAWAREHGFTGTELPKGDQSFHSCPLSRATGFEVTNSYAYGVDEAIVLPLLVAEFTRVFDRGEIPELIEANA